VTGWWFSPAMPVSSANKTDWHDITEILLKGALNTKAITVNHPLSENVLHFMYSEALFDPNIIYL
jgi:hypothetical protein